MNEVDFCKECGSRSRDARGITKTEPVAFCKNAWHDGGPSEFIGSLTAQAISERKWDRRFLDLAAHFATWSKDPSTKVGAVIVDDPTFLRRVCGVGYNGFPRGVSDEPGRYAEKLVKYGMIVHAEANAIMNADGRLLGCVLYTTKYPCASCAKMIIQSGIKRVVSPAPDTTGVWAEEAAFSGQMFSESGVEVTCPT